ncbi:unnamed protein product, partial [Prorocentrum cordatum]
RLARRAPEDEEGESGALCAATAATIPVGPPGARRPHSPPVVPPRGGAAPWGPGWRRRTPDDGLAQGEARRAGGGEAQGPPHRPSTPGASRDGSSPADSPRLVDR